jgi:hypothetical protein
MSRIRKNLAELDRQLARQKAVSRLKVEAGWCAALSAPATRSDEDLAIESEPNYRRTKVSNWD